LQHYGVGYCLRVNDPQRHGALVNRLYIPIVMNGTLVGWQGRHLINKTPKGIAKYYGLPNMPKRSMLYNLDVAKRWPFVVVVEGVTSVWRINGPSGNGPATALLGKALSAQQQKLLVDHWKNKPLILILDPDAKLKMEGLAHQLAMIWDELAFIYLPEGFDPDNYESEAIQNIILAAARARGIHLDPWL
jgi:DNA primase